MLLLLLLLLFFFFFVCYFIGMGHGVERGSYYSQLNRGVIGNPQSTDPGGMMGWWVLFLLSLQLNTNFEEVYKRYNKVPQTNKTVHCCCFFLRKVGIVQKMSSNNGGKFFCHTLRETIADNYFRVYVLVVGWPVATNNIFSDILWVFFSIITQLPKQRLLLFTRHFLQKRIHVYI